MIREYDDGYASREDFERVDCDTEESLREEEEYYQEQFEDEADYYDSWRD